MLIIEPESTNYHLITTNTPLSFMLLYIFLKLFELNGRKCTDWFYTTWAILIQDDYVKLERLFTHRDSLAIFDTFSK